MKKIIELKNVTKSFDGETVLDNISLDIYDNEFITLLGPSGCGKTTTLRLIGGFETPDSGDVVFMGERINDVPPYKRNVNTVFQRYALFPHLNVFENVAFPLREKKVDGRGAGDAQREFLRLAVFFIKARMRAAGVAEGFFSERELHAAKTVGGQQGTVSIRQAEHRVSFCVRGQSIAHFIAEHAGERSIACKRLFIQYNLPVLAARVRAAARKAGKALGIVQRDLLHCKTSVFCFEAVLP